MSMPERVLLSWFLILKASCSFPHWPWLLFGAIAAHCDIQLAGGRGRVGEGGGGLDPCMSDVG